MDVTIISINKSGTHFLVYLALVELGLTVQFDHTTSSFWRRLPDILALPAHTIITLEPKPAELAATGEPQWAIDELMRVYNEHLPTLQAAGALHFDIDDPTTLPPILAALGIPITPPIQNFIDEWPVIGPTLGGPRYDALMATVTNSNRHWAGKPVLGDGIT